MRYEKTEQRKRLKRTLKTVDIIGCGKVTPPLTARKRTAVL